MKETAIGKTDTVLFFLKGGNDRMKELGLTQQYLLCALNKNGKLSAWSVEQQVCLTGGALLELMGAGCCEEEGKKIAARKEPGEERSYLRPFYAYLAEKPRKISTIASDYAFSFTDKRIKELVYSVGGSLVKEGCAKEESKGILVESLRFYPEEGCVDNVIQQFRAELLEEGEVSDDIAALTALLDTSGLLKQYFSKYESEQLRKRIKEVRESEQGTTVKKMMEYVETMIIAVSISGSAAT